MMAGRDTKTRYQGVFARHQLYCAKSADRDARCNCTPSFYGTVWDARKGKQVKTKRYREAVAARNARNDLLESIRSDLPIGVSGMRLDTAAEKFVTAARDGVALNKWGRRYKPRAVDDLESALNRLPGWIKARRLDDLRRGEIQRAIDELVEQDLSGSRIRSIVNALRSLYHWALSREYVSANPAEMIQLPAMDSTPRDRVATPAEFTTLVAAVEVSEALPFALAAYGTARRQEIQHLDWTHVDLFKGKVMELAGTESGRKSVSSRRIVPLVSPLRSLLLQAFIEQGRPKTGKVCPPTRAKSGLIAIDHLTQKVRTKWKDAKLEPIGLHECRHTAATWLDHAGVSPKVASQLMGHSTPDRQAGAARITLERYTHVLPGEIERARKQLEAFLKERSKDERRTG